MTDKILPTRATAIAVRPESIPTPEGKTEKRELRSINSKTFLHSEKAADGKEIRTCQVQLGAVCYRDDNGELRSIDTTVRDLGNDEIGVEWAPYRFRLHPTGVGFDFSSREGGEVSIKLTGIGGDKFDQDTPLKSDITDNVIAFKDVRPGCDIVFKCLNQRVKTLRILRDASAPRTFEWAVTSDRPELIDSTLTGTDATGKSLDLTATVDGDVITETWAGGDVVYPVEIDPTVNATTGIAQDNGREVVSSGSWSEYLLNLGFVGGSGSNLGLRFPSLAIDGGVTVSAATLGLNSINVNGGGGSGVIYGNAVDDAAQFGVGNLPSAATKTAASTTVAVVGTTGLKSWDVTAIAQEILNRGGWANNNAMGFPIIGDASGGYTGFTPHHSGGNIPSLSITYTAGGGGGTSQNLLLLGCG